MSPTRQKKGPENIPVKTAIHVNFAAMTAAGYASAKNPATVKNQQKINLDQNPAITEPGDRLT
jgi:hypothetical protein